MRVPEKWEPSPGRMSGWARIVAFLERHPCSSFAEIYAATRIVEIRGRIVDARERGYAIIAAKDAAKVWRYTITGRPTTHEAAGGAGSDRAPGAFDAGTHTAAPTPAAGRPAAGPERTASVGDFVDGELFAPFSAGGAQE